MSVIWSYNEAEKATGGHNVKSWAATNVSIDSRTVEKGDLFVALKGEKFDGHDYVVKALAKGAVAAIVSHVPEGCNDHDSLLVVKDTMRALEALAKFRRNQTVAKIVAVTGSVGKTGVKEALRHVLGEQAMTHASKGNFNNHFGLPLSMARMPKEARYGVFELGMNHAGELKALSQMLKPHVGIITTVEAVHLEFFDSVEAIADAKAELFTGLEEGGVAVLNRDNPHYERLAALANKKKLKIINFGEHAEAQFRLVAYSIEKNQPQVEASCNGKTLDYSLNQPGRHHALNSLAVLAAVSALGEDIQRAAYSLGSLETPDGRGRIYEVKGKQSYTLIDDSYNASPVSMRAALEVLGHSNNAGRRIAVLGDMLELGKSSARLHKELAETILSCHVDQVFTVGKWMAKLHEALPEEVRGEHVRKSADLLPVLRAKIKEGDVVLIKGSHGSDMWKLAEALVG